MAIATSPATPKKTKPKPPDDAFWRRYSPHFEFPLSAIASVVLHTLAVILLILVGLGLIGFAKPKPLDMAQPVAIIDDTPGNPNAGGSSGAERQEKIDQPQDQPKVEIKPDEQVDVKVAPPEAVEFDPNTRFVEDAEAKEKRKAISEALQALSRPAGQRSGTGQGTGNGDGVGSGNERGEQKSKRAARWVISFNTRDGRDYLQQLAGLDAIVAVPAGNNQYRLFRNLRTVPVVGQIEDVSRLDRIYWVDGNAQSVASLANAMGIPVPEAIVAFFPKQLEEDLLQKERAYWNARRRGQSFNENRVAETRFQVMERGGVGRYELRVVDMRFQ
jgi:hypothetical protein